MRDGILWVAAANLVIWTGIFLYLMRLERRLAFLDRGSQLRNRILRLGALPDPGKVRF